MRTSLESRDRGASILLVASALFVLIGASAIAVDIGALWLQRSADQKVTDNAAAAAALELANTDGQQACEIALAYVAVNTDEISSLDDSGCATSFSLTCTAGESLTLTSGRFTITVAYPVVDGDPLMTSGIIGARSQVLHDDDGDACERFGVKMDAVRDSLFAQFLGHEQGSTSVHTVAVSTRSEEGPPINLLVLDRTACQTVHVQGNGGIIVDAVVVNDESGNPVGLTQGLIATDSDGSAGCSTDGVIDVEGSGSVMRADGPEGCPEQIGTHSVDSFTAGEGCGRIQVFAPGTPGCEPSVNTPACTPGSGGANKPLPEPTALNGRITRESVDHRFNCWVNYTTLPAGTEWATSPLTGDQSINGCGKGTPDHIYELIIDVGSSGNPVNRGLWTKWRTDLGKSCTVDSGTPDVTIDGNVLFDCASLSVKANVTVNGNVVFDGDVEATSGGHLEVSNDSGSPGWAFFRSGILSKGGSASLTFDQTTVYMSESSGVAMSGGSGSLTWIAPDNGDFNDLALWSDSPTVHQWAGQAGLVMEGIFFTPLATGDYSGTSGQNQTSAQWIADKLVARGQGTLVIRPSVERGISLGNPIVNLIR